MTLGSRLPKSYATRDLVDAHVLYLQESTSSTNPAFWDQIDSLDDEDLIRFLADHHPEALVVDEIASSEQSPSRKLMESMGTGTFAEAAQLVLQGNGEQLPPALNLLRRIPPDHIHRMQRAANWVGDFYSADMVFNTLAALGCQFEQGQCFFDYGCSSGSLLRAMAWAYPEIRFLGSDPVESSINWATQNLTFDNVEFLHQDQVPPISEIPNESVDYISAISIFSHHGYRATADWFDEMHRILKPGGIFFFTTNGTGSIAKSILDTQKPLIRHQRMAGYLVANGYVFEEVWLDQDDMGNLATSADWGNSYFLKSTLHEMLGERFEPIYFGSRLNQFNQDVYVIRKRAVA